MTIPVVFITDNNYAMPTSVAITSLIKNRNPDTRYDIFVIIDNVDQYNLDLIKSLDCELCKISFISTKSISGIAYSRSFIPDSIHVSEAALHKFMLASIFKNYEKMIYLDGDILILKDLTQLYNIDLSNQYAAVVKDMKPMMSYQPNQNEKLGVTHKAYFNTGVMLLNLSKLREDNIESKLIKYRSEGINFFMDQDAFNVVFQENVKYISYKFNMIYSTYCYYSYEELSRYYGLSETKNDFLNKICILHLSSKEKPWIYYDMEFSQLWDRYFLESPYKYKSLNRRSIDTTKNVCPISDLISLQNELLIVKNSFSYKLGRFLTYIPRQILAHKKTKERIKFNKNGLYLGPAREKKIIISLTSYPGRINVVPFVIESLLKQTMKPD